MKINRMILIAQAAVAGSASAISLMKNVFKLMIVAVITGTTAASSVEVDKTAMMDGIPSMEALKNGFENPPESCRPAVIWYWRYGEHTKEGITADLEAMNKSGIGGVFIGFIGDSLSHDHPAGSVPVMSDKWRELHLHAAREAARLGISVSLFNSPGWSSSGGPWITPEMAMQEVAWTEVHVTAEQKGSIKLPKPHLRELKSPWKLTKKNGEFIKNNRFLGDIAVLAFPTPDAERDRATPVATYLPKPETDLSKVLDNNRHSNGSLPNPEPGKPNYLQFRYPKPTTIRSLSFMPRHHQAHVVEVVLENSQDGREWVLVGRWKPRGWNPMIKSIAPASAPFWRVGLSSGENGPKTLGVAEVALHAGARVPDWTGKAMFERYSYCKPPFASKAGEKPDLSTVIAPHKIVDITDKMDPDGTLNWKPASGNWTVMRFSRVLTMAYNAPAGKAGTGLDCDKFNPKAVELHWDNYIAPFLKDKDYYKAFEYVHVDSYEQGSQNWSPVLPGEFKQQRGYDIIPYLPVMTGRVIGSMEQSERFLWDLRQTASDTMARNYYGHLAKLAHKNGKKISVEPYHQEQFDNVTVGGTADMVVTEFWQATTDHLPGAYWFKLGASPAHVYGKKLVGAEAFTSKPKGGGNWSTDPWALKRLGDRALCMGINQFIYHVYTQQPWLDLAPGCTTGPFGSQFTRTNTWFNLGYGWNKYLSRGQYMLRQGLFVGDVLFSVGENTPNKSADTGMGMPKGYDYDNISPEAILTRLSVRNGRFFLPDGISYSVLVLPENDRFMSAAMAKKIHDLVNAGGIVMGPRPLRSPTLSHQPAEDKNLIAIASRLWGNMDGKTIRVNKVGKGHMFWGYSLGEVLKKIDCEADFLYAGGAGKLQLDYIHRTIGEDDLYYIANTYTGRERNDEQGRLSADCSFRVTDKVPELWDPVSGSVRSLPDYSQQKGRTVIPLEFEPRQAYFIRFQPRSVAKAQSKSVSANFPKVATTQELKGPWKVSFDPKWFYPDEGRNAKISFETLQDWSTHNSTAVKYFSGTALYQRSFDLQDTTQLGNKLCLSLGTVYNMAEVHLNGHNLGVVWCAPWQLEIPRGVLKAKGNSLTLKVCNLWPNRLIGDEQLPEDCQWKDAGGFEGERLDKWPAWLMDNTPRTSGRRTFSTWKHWTKESPLLPSGLLGPVTLKVVK